MLSQRRNGEKVFQAEKRVWTKAKKQGKKRVWHIEGRAMTPVAYLVALPEGSRLRNPTAGAGPEHERVMIGRKLDLLWFQQWLWGREEGDGGTKGVYQESSN